MDNTMQNSYHWKPYKNSSEEHQVPDSFDGKKFENEEDKNLRCSIKFSIKNEETWNNFAIPKVEKALLGLQRNAGQLGLEELYYLDSYFEGKEFMDLVAKCGGEGNGCFNVEHLSPEDQERFREII
jgi:hypothetical protein